jgi:hypothetical protein
MKFLIALGATALLTAACTASASVPGSGGTVKTANSVHLAAGTNAGSDAPGDLDVNRVNPLIGKAGSHPVAPSQLAPVAPAAAPASNAAQDRCSGGPGNAQGPQTNAAVTGKRPPLPACMPE